MTDLAKRLALCAGTKKPRVGSGATIVCGSDRYPATVIEASRTGHKIVLQYDDARRTDSNGQSEDQTWEITPNPNARTTVATRRRNGAYRIKGETTRVLLGTRDMYQDPSF